MVKRDVIAALHRSAILVATISDRIYRPRRGRITGTIVTNQLKMTLIKFK